MTMMKLIYRVILTLTLFFAVTASSAAQTRLGFDGEKAASIGVLITDISSGDAVCSINPDRALIPASTLKIVTAATSLLKAGKEFHYKTELITTGTIEGSTLHGNLIVRGWGDPTIAHPDFPETNGFIDSLASAVEQSGIKVITGCLKISDEMLPDAGTIPQWELEDVGWGYGAGLYPVNYNGNKVKINPFLAIPVDSIPTGDVITDIEITDDSDTEIIHGICSNYYLLKGRKLSDPSYTVETVLPSTEFTFTTLLESALLNKGIIIESGDVPDGFPALLHTMESPDAVDIMTTMMHKSDNLIAEATLRSIAPGKPRKDALETERAIWDSISPSCRYTKMLDGSGLSRGNLVSPRFMSDVLIYMAKSDLAPDYIGLFPKTGKDGTVKNFMKGTRLAGRLALKSGSMSGVHCYAGYHLDETGKPTHAVVIMINNFFCQRSEIRNAIKTLLLKQFH